MHMVCMWLSSEPMSSTVLLVFFITSFTHPSSQPRGHVHFHYSHLMNELTKTQKLSQVPGHISVRWQLPELFLQSSCSFLHFKLLHNCRSGREVGRKQGRKEGGREEKKAGKEAERKELDTGERMSLQARHTKMLSEALWALGDPGRRRMKSLNPSVWWGTLWGKWYANVMMQWGEIHLACTSPAWAQAGTALRSLQRQITRCMGETFTAGLFLCF